MLTTVTYPTTISLSQYLHDLLTAADYITLEHIACILAFITCELRIFKVHRLIYRISASH